MLALKKVRCQSTGYFFNVKLIAFFLVLIMLKIYLNLLELISYSLKNTSFTHFIIKQPLEANCEKRTFYQVRFFQEMFY